MEHNVIGIIKTIIRGEFAYSGILIYNVKEKQIIFKHCKAFKPIFTEYFPTVLFLNQTDIYVDLIKNLEYTPDCYIVNSSGRIHPFFYGTACDLGMRINIPIIGYTNKLLIGEIKKKIVEKASFSEIFYHHNLVGYRISKPNTKKFYYISVGNNISLETSLKIFLNLDYKLFSLLKMELEDFIKLTTES